MVVDLILPRMDAGYAADPAAAETVERVGLDPMPAIQFEHRRHRPAQQRPVQPQPAAEAFEFRQMRPPDGLLGADTDPVGDRLSGRQKRLDDPEEHRLVP
ncbi:MAG: hypothetical protein FD152_1051 [Xanthobacteraceae bacterium]|nr:MAG: hypothetical protein FD152_1051 [Xanthobacteraceae bacterium]